MNGNKNHESRSKGHFYKDCECSACKYFRGKRRGCKFDNCRYEDEKLNTIAGERNKRKRGVTV